MLTKIRDEIRAELSSILEFWTINTLDEANGGFIGKMDHNHNIYIKAEKGGVLNARILWTFSAAAGFSFLSAIEKEQCLRIAKRSFDYFKNHFIDKGNGGVFWSLNPDGTPKSTRKQIYGLSFAIYGLSEYYHLTKKEEALTYAKELFELIEKYSFDERNGGYLEAFSEDWQLLEDLRLSEKDRNDPKTMNTHLHIIEAYVNLYKVWPTEMLNKRIRQLLSIFESKIIVKKTGHMKLFFDKEWNAQSQAVSFGHDIEASWLLYESAQALKDKKLIKKWANIALKMAESAMDGLNLDGSLNHEFDQANNHLDDHREWWVSAEAMVGFFNAYELSGEKRYLCLVGASWEFIKENLIDYKNGEWYWGVYPPSEINEEYELMSEEDKVGFWKCPYHNGRACMEIVRRIDKLSSKK